MAVEASLSPTSELLAQCGTFAACSVAAGMFQPLQPGATTTTPTEMTQALFDLMGVDVTTQSSFIALTSDEEFEDTFHHWGHIDQQDGSWHYPTMVDKGRARLALRYARMFNSLPAGGQTAAASAGVVTPTQVSGDPNIAAFTAQIERLATSTAAAISRDNAATVNLREIISQTNDTTARRLTQAEVFECFKRYERQYGPKKKPKPGAEPTVEQLSAVRHLIASGETPFVEFAVWGPHGQRMTGQVFNARGELVTVELVCPPTYQMWEACYTIFQHTLLMLGEVDLGNLIEYRDYMKGYYEKYGDRAYALVYQADTRSRLEQMIRLQREAASDYEAMVSASGGTQPANWPYDPQRQWNYAWSKILKEDRWWWNEVESPALIVVATTATVSDTFGGDAPVSHATPPGNVQGLSPTVPATVDVRGYTAGTDRPAPKRGAKPRTHNVAPCCTKYLTSRGNVPLCQAFNSAAGCSPAVGGQWCPHAYALHLCERCLKPDHCLAAPCPKAGTPIPTPPAFARDGERRKGKGKGDTGKGKGGKLGCWGRGKGGKGGGWGARRYHPY